MLESTVFFPEIGVLAVKMYLMQGLFFNIINTPYQFFNVVSNIVLGTTMPLIICYLMKHKKLSMVFFGKII